MKELKIGEKIIECRRQQGITQDDLAQYMGVSKASVSKWETSTSYPDITLLPRIASYFSITVDELLGYEPQMSKRQIRSSIQQLSQNFLSEPFVTAKQKCVELTQKYYSCFPLLYQIGSLYMSHSGMVQDQKCASILLTDAIDLFRRIQKHADEIDLKKQARSMEAMCLLYLNRSDEALELLGEPDFSFTSDEPIFASAYRRSGEIKKAKGILQVGLYQHVVVMMNLLASYLGVVADEPEKFNETQSKAYALIDAFSLETLHPAIVFPFYLAVAQCYAKQRNSEKMIEVLKKYTHLATSKIYPIQFHGDPYFDLMDLWFDENLTLGHMMVRSEQAIKDSIASSVLDNPIFAELKDDNRFFEISHKLSQLRKEVKNDSQRIKETSRWELY